MKLKSLLLPGLFIIPGVSVSASAAAEEVAKTIYTCNDNKTMEVVYINTTGGNSYAIINQVNEMIPMRLMKMASGANYEAISQDYTYKLYTKGKTADLVEGDDKPVLSNCLSDN
ncbi:c-type lysozyme inhibitor [Salmonella enterica]|uniref:c-type lysozyme inhibitor n=1 Tax=Salmonella enterica TaxID=28901 RepID=UPI001D969B4D|nr:c-type lysozyme inhibitor [Salmonella enterica]EGY8942388.1 c-type lysozyme inhibitor [Salmonella enterica subsp. diarizonae serovar 60:r:z]